MDGEKLEFDEASGLEDHFHFLPDELLLFIFNKMATLKNLCHCSLVSKRFASVISHIRDVSFTLPRSEAYSRESYKRVYTLFHEVSQLAIDELPGFLKQSFHKLKLPIFLEKFLELESIYLEYTCSRNDDNPSLFKWKVNCRSDTAKVKSFVAMLPVSVHKRSEFVPGQELLTMENSTNFIQSQRGNCFWSSFGCYTEWLFLIYTLINCHTTLRSVTVTDSGKKGKLVISDEQLFRLRSRFPIKDRGVRNLKSAFKIAWVPELHLPVSGYVMRGVCLVAIKVPNESDASGEGDDIITWDFEEEEKVFGEVIKEVFKNHRDKIQPVV